MGSTHVLHREERLRSGTTSGVLCAVGKYLLPAARKADLLEFEVFTDYRRHVSASANYEQERKWHE